MLFDSPVYFLFLAIVVLIYWRLERPGQNRFLLAASYFFYGWWDWRFVFLMLASTTVDFWIARAIDHATGPRRKRAWLILSIVLNLGCLGFFKYFHFFLGSASQAFRIDLPTLRLLEIILPLGISFYTFQEIAYIVDVYSGKLAPSRHFTEYALFISLFPHLIAGPIQRPGHLLPQVQQPRVFDADKFFDGLMLIVSGLFRKLVIAGQSEVIANAAFNGHFGRNAAATLIGTLAFAMQIYGDFSAYSDLARGSAQLLGFHFMVNFRQPYLATSLQDFWRRWHISLSTWLRDYLYIPLGGSRHGEWMTYRNLLLTMLLGGLWHGANWTFIVWGLIHGAGLSVERFVAGARLQEPRTFAAVWIRRLATFAVVCFGWIFFRAATLPEAVRLIGDLGRSGWDVKEGPAILVLLFVISLVLVIDLWMEQAGTEYVSATAGFGRRIATAGALLLLAFAFGASNSNAFIYFQF